MFRSGFLILAIALILVISLPLAAEDQADVTVIVTAERTAQPVSESIATATVITAKQIREGAAQNVADVLKMVPGVTVQQNGQTGSLTSAHLRGTATSQVLVLVDGQRITSAAFGGAADLSKLPISDVLRIEVIRGPASSLYGSDAIGGVINVITRKPSGRKVETRLGGGTNDRMSRFVSVSDGGEKMAWKLTTDFPAYGGQQSNSDYSATDLSGRLDFNNLKGWELSLKANDYHDALGLPGPSTFPSPNDRQWWNRTSFDLSANRALGAGRLELNLGSMNQKLHEVNPDFFMLTNIDGETETADAIYRVTRGRQDLVLGGEYMTESYKDVEGGSVQADKSITNSALYAQDRLAINTSTDLLIGARLDDHSTAGSKITPRIGLNRAMGEKTRVRASYAEGFRAPSLVDLYYNNFGTVGNPNLKPEKSHQYEVGVNTMIGKDTMDLALFTNKVADQIVWTSAATPGNPWAGTFSNVSEARQQGVELSWDHSLTKAVNLCAFYSYIDARNQTTGARLPGIPYNQAGLTLAGKMNGWNTALTGRWSTDRIYGGGVKVKAVAVIDLTLTDDSQKSVAHYITFRNLTNAHYEEVAGYQAEGRTVEVGVRTNW